MLLRDLLDLAALLDQYTALCRGKGNARVAAQAGDVWIAVRQDVKELEHEAQG